MLMQYFSSEVGIVYLNIIQKKFLLQAEALKAQWLLCVPPVLALKHSVFCPHSVGVITVVPNINCD
jgi:hypothetical protein